MQTMQRETDKTTQKTLNTLATLCYQQVRGENRLLEIARSTQLPVDVVERIFSSFDAKAQMPRKQYHPK